MSDSFPKDSAGNIRDFFKRWPNIYFFIATVFGPMMFCGLSGKNFLKQYPRAGKTLNLGSGPRVIGADVTNVDMYQYPGVSVVADIMSLPFEANSVARIVSDNVLEHIKDPYRAVKEMHRVLEPGGLIYVSTPFLYPFHSSPADYNRWTMQGLKELTKDFELVQGGNRAGPFSALTVYLNYFFSTLFSFGNAWLYWILVNVFMFLFFPIKLLDIIFNYWPRVENMAAVLYIVVRKK